MKIWSVQNAKTRFSKFLDTFLELGHRLATKRDVDAPVLLPTRDRQRLQQSARPTLKELLLTEEPRGEMQPPPRGRLRRRLGVRTLNPFERPDAK